MSLFFHATDYVDGYVSDRSLDHSKVSDRWDSRKQKVKDTGGFVGANTNYGPGTVSLMCVCVFCVCVCVCGRHYHRKHLP